MPHRAGRSLHCLPTQCPGVASRKCALVLARGTTAEACPLGLPRLASPGACSFVRGYRAGLYPSISRDLLLLCALAGRTGFTGGSRVVQERERQRVGSGSAHSAPQRVINGQPLQARGRRPHLKQERLGAGVGFADGAAAKAADALGSCSANPAAHTRTVPARGLGRTCAGRLSVALARVTSFVDSAERRIVGGIQVHHFVMSDGVAQDLGAHEARHRG